MNFHLRFYYINFKLSIFSRRICEKLLEMLKGGSNDEDIERKKNGVNKVLNAPVHLGTMAATLEAQVEQIKSIWVNTRDDAMVSF